MRLHSESMRHSVMKLIGVMDDASGSSKGLANAVSGAAKFMGELAEEIFHPKMIGADTLRQWRFGLSFPLPVILGLEEQLAGARERVEKVLGAPPAD